MKAISRPYVRVSQDEYRKLKNLERRFARFWAYFEHLNDIREARKNIAKRQTAAQETLFAELGL